MKLHHIFENEETLSEKDLEIWNWIIRDYLMTPVERIDRVRGFWEKSKLQPYEFYLKNKNIQSRFPKHQVELFNSIVINGNVVNCGGYDLWQIKDPPPFKFGEIGLEWLATRDERVFGKIGFFLNNIKEIDSVPEWFPSKIDLLQINSCNIRSLSNIKNVIKRCDRIYISGSYGAGGSTIHGAMLGTLLIPGLTGIWIEGGLDKYDGETQQDLDEYYNKHFLRAVAIINKYLPEGDILDCQEELIDAGLEEYAKI